MANEKTSRPQPRSNDSGVRNWPSAERGPNAISAIAHPIAIRIAGVRQDSALLGATAIDMARLRRHKAPRRSRRGDGFINKRRPRQAKTKVRDGNDLRTAWLPFSGALVQRRPTCYMICSN